MRGGDDRAEMGRGGDDVIPSLVMLAGSFDHRHHRTLCPPTIKV